MKKIVIILQQRTAGFIIILDYQHRVQLDVNSVSHTKGLNAMKKIITLIFYTRLLLFIICTSLSVQAKTKIMTPAKVRVRSSESKRLKVTWNRVKKADGYQIYEYKKSNKKFVKVADVDSKAKSWKSRNTEEEHTYKVRAYRKIGKKKMCWICRSINAWHHHFPRRKIIQPMIKRR